MTRRVLALVGTHVAVATALSAWLVVNGDVRLSVISIAAACGLGVAFALVGLLPMHLELGRSACTVTLVEAVLVLGFLFMNPGAVVLGVAFGETLACLVHRQSRLKLLFNTVATTTAAFAAAAVFVLCHHLGATASWTPALAAVYCYATLNQVSTSAVLSIVEGRRLRDVFAASVLTVGMTTTVSVSIGLAAGALWRTYPLAPLLLGPLVFTVALETKRLAAHRAEHLRFERLYAASARTTGLQAFDDALAVSAAEARSLVTGASAVCCAPGRDGDWRGMVVDDAGIRPAPRELVDAVVRLVGSRGAVEMPVAQLDPDLRAFFRTAGSIVSAGRTTDDDAPVALAVGREIRGDDQGEARSEVLAAFVGHAALTATNARLYEDVEDALRQQVDLNRQKDDFLAAVSHELRTPLAAVLGSVATLRRLEGRLPEDTRDKFFDMAARQGKRLQRLIEELLLIAAIDQEAEVCVVESVDVVAMLDELEADLQEFAADRIVVTVTTGAETVRTDGGKLRQVLVNLVENAAKYAPDGAIDVVASPSPRGGITVAVIDHGPGIPATERERVFERFVQLDQSSTRAQGGTGLGLYLCRRLGELLGASLELTDTPGGGCTFTVLLSTPIEEMSMCTDPVNELAEMSAS